MEDDNSSMAQAFSFSYYYKTTDGDYQAKTIPAGPSCAKYDLSKSFTTTFSIDESDPAHPHTTYP